MLGKFKLRKVWLRKRKHRKLDFFIILYGLVQYVQKYCSNKPFYKNTFKKLFEHSVLDVTTTMATKTRGHRQNIEQIEGIK